MKMKFLAAVFIAITFSVFSAAGQSGAQWNQYKQQNGIDPSWSYNAWVNAGCPRNSQSASPSVGMNAGQQALNQAASQVGQQIGKGLADWILGNNSGPSQADIQAQQAAQAAQQAALHAEQERQAEMARQAAERARLQRIANAANLRQNWNANDAAMSQQLSGVFDTPVGSSTPAFGSNVSSGLNPDDTLLNDTSVVDLRGTSAGTDFFGSGNNSVVNPDDALLNDTSVVDLRGTSAGGPPGFEQVGISQDSSVVSLGDDGNQMAAVDPNFLAAQQLRAEQTQDFYDNQRTWNTMPPGYRAETPGLSFPTEDFETVISQGLDLSKTIARKTPTYAGYAATSVTYAVEKVEGPAGYIADMANPFTEKAFEPADKLVKRLKLAGDMREAYDKTGMIGVSATFNGRVAGETVSTTITGAALTVTPEACLAGGLVAGPPGCVVSVIGVMGLAHWSGGKAGRLTDDVVKYGTEQFENIPTGSTVHPEHPGTYGFNIAGETTAAGFQPAFLLESTK